MGKLWLGVCGLGLGVWGLELFGLVSFGVWKHSKAGWNRVLGYTTV